MDKPKIDATLSHSDLPPMPESVQGYTEVIDTSTNVWLIRASSDGGNNECCNLNRLAMVTTECIPVLSIRAFKLFKLFLIHKLERRKASTVRGYLNSIRPFLKWLSAHDEQVSFPFEWYSLTPELVEQYRVYLQDVLYASHAPLSCLCTFYQWGISQEYPDFSTDLNYAMKNGIRNRTIDNKYIRDFDPIHGPFDEDERLMIRQALNANVGQPIVRALVMLCYFTGARAHSLVRLKSSDLEKIETSSDPRFYLQMPHSKRGTQDRTTLRYRIPLPLGFLLEELKLDIAESPLLHWLDPKVPERHMREMVKDWAHTADLISLRTGKRMNLTPYRFRHNLATKLAEMNASPLLIAVAMGHKDTRMAHAYIETSETIGDKAGQALDPLAKPLIDRFLGRILPPVEASSDDAAETEQTTEIWLNAPQINLVKTMNIGRCGRTDQQDGSCNTMPLGCYTCDYFRPFQNADHDEVSQSIKTFKEKHRGKVDTRTLRQFDEIELAIDTLLTQISYMNQEHAK